MVGQEPSKTHFAQIVYEQGRNRVSSGVLNPGVSLNMGHNCLPGGHVIKGVETSEEQHTRDQTKVATDI